MISAIMILVGLGLTTVCMHGLIKTFDTKNNLFSKILSPLLKEVEETIEEKKEEVIKKVQTEVTNKYSELPSQLKGDVGEVLQDGINSIQNALFNSNSSIYDFGDSDATIIITNDSMQPFQITSKIAKECNKIGKGLNNNYDKAKALFDWFEANITYDYNALKKKRGYRSSKQVFEDKKGICGEMTFLYIVMAWYLGIKSACFVEVDVDVKGKKVDHACVAFDWKLRKILVDPAYHTFDIKHKKIDIWSNEKSVGAFKAWN